MQYLKQIVNAVNDLVKAGLNDSRFNDSAYYGIAIPASNGEKVLPLIPDIYDEDTYITPDDSRPLVIYHRTLNISRTDQPVKSYGDKGNMAKQENDSMAMIIMATRIRVKMTSEELEAAIVSLLPSVALPAATLATMNLSSCMVIPTTSELDPVKVYLAETKNRVFDLPPGQLMIQVNYTIRSTYTANCFNIAHCEEC